MRVAGWIWIVVAGLVIGAAACDADAPTRHADADADADAAGALIGRCETDADCQTVRYRCWDDGARRVCRAPCDHTDPYVCPFRGYVCRTYIVPGSAPEEWCVPEE